MGFLSSREALTTGWALLGLAGLLAVILLMLPVVCFLTPAPTAEFGGQPAWITE